MCSEVIANIDLDFDSKGVICKIYIKYFSVIHLISYPLFKSHNLVKLISKSSKKNFVLTASVTGPASAKSNFVLITQICASLEQYILAQFFSDGLLIKQTSLAFSSKHAVAKPIKKHKFQPLLAC